MAEHANTHTHTHSSHQPSPLDPSSKAVHGHIHNDSQVLSLNLSVCCCTTSYYTDSQVAEPFTSSERKKREREISECEGEREKTLAVWSAEAIFS